MALGWLDAEGMEANCSGVDLQFTSSKRIFAPVNNP